MHKPKYIVEIVNGSGVFYLSGVEADGLDFTQDRDEAITFDLYAEAQAFVGEVEAEDTEYSTVQTVTAAGGDPIPRF